MSFPGIAVVDSGVANLTSVMAALARLGAEAEITADSARIKKAGHVIVPGVGAAAAAMAHFNEKNLGDTLRGLTQPVLGICLGMQVLFGRSFEGKGEPVQCLGILPGDVRLLQSGPDRPVPHMGWNRIDPVKKDHPLLKGIDPGSYVYFVHSYAAAPGDATIAATEYGETFTSMIGLRNFFGCQFHPERSSVTGSRIIENFLKM